MFSVYRRFPTLLLLLALPGLASEPARHPSFEPIKIDASPTQNLFFEADTEASGQWSDRAPALAVNGKLDLADHWACEGLPVWHQVNLKQATEISSIRVWPYWGDARVYQYQVEGSINGEDWTLLADMSANSIAADANGQSFNFEPIKLRHIRTTFTHNSRGANNGGHLVQIEGYANADNAELKGGIGSIDRRYPPQGEIDELLSPEQGIKVNAWRGERVSAQVIVSSTTSHSSLHCEPITLQLDSDESHPPIEASARFVRYTLADSVPQGDILDPIKTLELPSGANRPVWIEINVPQHAPGGLYQGQLRIVSDQSALSFPIQLEVLAATLPPPAEWQIHLDLWQHPQAVARWHDVEPWSDLHLALLRPSMIRLAQAGQKTITTSLINEPWGAQTYDWFPSMIKWIKNADGSWHYDYSIFDRWVTFMSEECGFGNARIHGYSMIPWSLKFRYFDAASQTWVDQRIEPQSKEYDALWGAFLRDFQAHLESKGWLERMRIAVDERPDRLMRGALDTLARHAPDILVASAINHPTELVRELDDLSPIINHTKNFSTELLQQRRSDGRKTTFYVCTAPPVPNTFTFSPPAESEWLPLFASAQGFDGFLRWAYHSWVENPLVSTDFTSWPSGDCFLIYPGNRSSIRFERLRDGIENFEKIRILRQAAASQNSPEANDAIAELDQILAQFTWQRGRQPGVHTDDVHQANQAILNATRIIKPQLTK